jgi:hypothetical protein
VKRAADRLLGLRYSGHFIRSDAMHLLLAFAPFVVFALLSLVLGNVAALALAATVSAGLIVHNYLKPASAKILEVGTFVLFAGLGIYCWTSGSALSLVAVKLLVDLGLFAIALGSMLVGQPFTIQYAKEQVPQDLWSSPAFRRMNYVITGVWSLAFLVICLAEAAIILLPELPPRIGIAAVIGALVAAAKFTGWYPDASSREAG